MASLTDGLAIAMALNSNGTTWVKSRKAADVLKRGDIPPRKCYEMVCFLLREWAGPRCPVTPHRHAIPSHLAKGYTFYFDSYLRSTRLSARRPILAVNMDEMAGHHWLPTSWGIRAKPIARLNNQSYTRDREIYRPDVMCKALTHEYAIYQVLGQYLTTSPTSN
jgi:hypothetical protein